MERCYPRLDSINAHPVRIYAGLEAVVPDIEYVTFLRDPIERTASHYQYDVQVGGVDIPFDEWITHEAVPDRQTRILAGPDASGEDAIALLGRFAFVGRTDRFDESLDQVRDVIVSAKVGQFVRQDGFYLVRRKAARQRCGQQNRRLDHTDNHRHRDAMTVCDGG